MKWKLKNTYCELPQSFYSYVGATEFPEPKLLYLNEALVKELGLDEILEAYSDDEKAQIFSGNEILEGSTPIACAYAGHQFAYFNLLGDGRARLLGEWEVPKESVENKESTESKESVENKESDYFDLYDIQLKGSGRTPYSRGGDGRATISSVLREYLVSEAMHYLGVPTTRSLAVTLTGEKIYRDGYSDGAVLTRVAKSHLRVGTFQFVRYNEPEEVRTLCDYAIERYYPQFKDLPDRGRGGKYIEFFARVAQDQAALIAKWQLSGFIHGVMNTDNMSICGETIDYGPCAFMDAYNPMKVFSSIDTTGRYRYENQPTIGKWNLARLAEAMFELIDDEEETAINLIQEKLTAYDECFQRHWLNGMRRKLGIDYIKRNQVGLKDVSAENISVENISVENISAENIAAKGLSKENAKGQSIACKELKKEEAHTLDMDDKSLIKTLLNLMQINKADFTNTFIRLTKAINGEDASYLEGTDALFGDPKFFKWTEKWKRRQVMTGLSEEELYQSMKHANPFVIPRNHLVEDALLAFEAGNSEVFEAFLEVLKHPYDYEKNDFDIAVYQKTPPKSMSNYKTYCGT